MPAYLNKGNCCATPKKYTHLKAVNLINYYFCNWVPLGPSPSKSSPSLALIEGKSRLCRSPSIPSSRCRLPCGRRICAPSSDPCRSLGCSLLQSIAVANEPSQLQHLLPPPPLIPFHCASSRQEGLAPPLSPVRKRSHRESLGHWPREAPTYGPPYHPPALVPTSRQRPCDSRQLRRCCPMGVFCASCLKKNTAAYMGEPLSSEPGEH
jgi:hypothetical protein